MKQTLHTFLLFGPHNSERLHTFELREERRANNWDNIEWVVLLDLEEGLDIDLQLLPRSTGESCSDGTLANDANGMCRRSHTHSI